MAMGHYSKRDEWRRQFKTLMKKLGVQTFLSWVGTAVYEGHLVGFQGLQKDLRQCFNNTGCCFLEFRQNFFFFLPLKGPTDGSAETLLDVDQDHMMQ